MGWADLMRRFRVLTPAAQLIMIARDGEIADSQPRPNVGGIGNDTTNLRHGSYGVLDPTFGFRGPALVLGPRAATRPRKSLITSRSARTRRFVQLAELHAG